MTEQQKRFCEHYAACASAAQAARNAGYSESYALRKSYELLKKPEIAEYIRTLCETDAEKRIADGDEIRRFWTKVMNDEDCSMTARIKASEHLAKAKGMFTKEW